MRKFASIAWAAAITAAITIWIFKGPYLLDKMGIRAEKKQAGEVSRSASGPARVRVRVVHAQMRNETLFLRGRTEAVARVEVRAQTSGQIIAVPVKKGAFVKKGAVLCMLDMGARKAQLAEAEAALAQAELDYKASTALSTSGFASKTREAANKARRDAALAAISRVKLDIERTRITAPFAGVIEEQPAKIGDLLQQGGSCATLVQQDPILVTGQVSERNISGLKVNMKAKASLVTGEKVSGHIRFIASSAEPATRTFKIELEVANPDRRLRDGVTARIEIPLALQKAHLVASSLLLLSDAGEIGVRIVDKDNVVRFMPVKILDDGITGTWVGGLPEKVTLITTGQGYVRHGQKVEPVFSTASSGIKS